MTHLKIEIVSDVMCPWCIIGYKGLEAALARLTPEISADVRWLPFELNPHMPVEGQPVREHVMEKYGISAEQSAHNRSMMAARGQEVGFEFCFSEGLRIINSFDLHRLLAWAETQTRQHALKLAFFHAHFTENRPLNDRATLLDVVASVGLDKAAATAVLDSDQYVEAVRREEQESLNKGIHSVPTFIINDAYAITGGQTAEVFERALQEIADKISRNIAAE